MIVVHIGLSAQDCFIMGQTAFNTGFYARSVEWFEQSHFLAEKENNQTVSQYQVMEFTQHAINKVFSLILNKLKVY